MSQTGTAAAARKPGLQAGKSRYLLGSDLGGLDSLPGGQGTVTDIRFLTSEIDQVQGFRLQAEGLKMVIRPKHVGVTE
jgi:hypothetical protein